MSNRTSGIIINNDIFINSDQVVKVEKFKNAEDTYEMDIYVTAGSPVKYFFDNEHEVTSRCGGSCPVAPPHGPGSPQFPRLQGRLQRQEEQ